MKNRSTVLAIILFSILAIGAGTTTSNFFPHLIDKTNIVCGTRDCSLVYAGGIKINKEVTLAGNGAQTDNLFQVHGQIRVIQVGFTVQEATDSTTLSLVKFEVDDGTAQADITDTVDCSGVVQGAIAYKSVIATDPLELIDAAAAAVHEESGPKVNFEFMVVQKTGDVATYVRLSYTGDATTDVDIRAFIRYQPQTGQSYVEAI